MKPIWQILIAVVETVVTVVKSIFGGNDTPALNG